MLGWRGSLEAMAIMRKQWQSPSPFGPLPEAVVENSFILGGVRQRGLRLLVGELAFPLCDLGVDSVGDQWNFRLDEARPNPSGNETAGSRQASSAG